MLLSNILVPSQPKMVSAEDWSVCSYRNPSFKRRAGTDGFVPTQRRFATFEADPSRLFSRRF